MREGIWRHVTRNAVAYLALFVALTGTAYGAARIGSPQIVDNSVRSIDIRDRGVKGVDIARRTLRADHFRPGVLRRGAQGQAGAAGPAGPAGPAGARGPSFGDSRQVGNLKDIACNQLVTIATLPLTATEPGRVWTHGQGAILKDGAPVDEGALWLRLRDAGGTVVANSVPAWDADADGADPKGDTLWALSPGGLLRAGADPSDADAGAFVAAAGAYTLELVALVTGGACTTAIPDFGWNQGGAMGYVLVGTR